MERRRISRPIIAGLTAVAVTLTIGAPAASAAPPSKDGSSPTAAEAQSTPSEGGDLEGTTEARQEVQEQLGGASASLDGLVERTADLGEEDETAASGSREAGAEPGTLDKTLVESLPTLDEGTGALTLPDTTSGGRATIQVKGSHATDEENGVVTSSGPYGVKAVGHVTERMSGQMIGLIDTSAGVHSVDFQVTLPHGDAMRPNADGSIEIVDKDGVSKGQIARPWAVNDAGQKLPSHFEVTGSEVKQVLDGSGDVGVVALDPNFAWWAATVGKCAVEIAPLFATGGAAVAARAPRLVAKVVELTNKSAKMKAAVEKVGGAKNAAVALVKRGAQELKDHAPGFVKDKLPDGVPSEKEKAFAAVAWPFVVDHIWDLLGFGSCAEIVKGGN